MINLLWSVVFMVLLLSGCGWNGTPTRNNDFTPLTSIEISAVSPTVAAGTSTKLSVKGNFSELFTRDITDQVVWSSDTPTVAGFITAASPNRVTGKIPGTAILTATMGSVSATFKLTVSSATVTALTITPAAPSIAKGLAAKFTVLGTFSDSTTQDLTIDATWASSAPAVATVSDVVGSKGFAQTLTVGTSTITATFNGISDTALLTVTEPVLQSIAVTPANPSVLSLSTTDSFTATGTYSDGSTKIITDQVNWASSSIGIATIATSGGAATTLSQGTTSISATPLPSVPSDPGVSGATNLKVTGGNLNNFTVSPAIVTLVKGTVGRITATGTFSNGSRRDITGAPTGAFTWSPANSSLASVTAAGGNLVWLNALAVTPTTIITATSGTLTPFTTTLTVIDAPQLLSIAIFTTSPELTAGSLTAGTSARFTVTATFNGATQDVTTLSTWTSDAPTVATVGTSGLAAGRVNGVAAGSTTIRATYGGITALNPATFTVRSRILQSLTITPPTVTIGNQVPFTATANYTDLTIKDVTEDTTWSIDKPNVAILADSVNQPGQVVGVDIGSATLTVILGGNSDKPRTAVITVTGP